MSAEEFNEKYKAYLEEGHYGLALSKPEAIEYLDKEFEEFIKLPNFSYSQIKSKFNEFRFYNIGVSDEKTREVENKLKEIHEANKEFIPYADALALKELGFDEPCFGYYWIHDKELVLNLNTPFQGYHKGFDGSISAPTFSQCFRWFREKYRLYHVINMFGDWDKPQYGYIVSGKTMDNPAHMWHYENKDSYEEAELACLIKLIEIVKDK